MLVLTLSFSCSVYVKFISEQDQNFLNVFHLKRATAIQFVDGNTSYWISQSTNDSLQYDRIKKDANIFWNAKACSEYGISDTIYSRTLLLKKGFWHFKDKKGLILHSDSKIPVINEQIVLDYLIITGSPKFKLSDLKNISFHQIIIDSSVPIWIRNNWKNELYAEKIHFTQNKGAFIQKIQL